MTAELAKGLGLLALLGLSCWAFAQSWPFVVPTYFMLRRGWPHLGPSFRARRVLMREAHRLSIARNWTLLARAEHVHRLALSLLAYALFLEARLLGLVFYFATLILWAWLRVSLPPAVLLLGESSPATLFFQVQVKRTSSPQRVVSMLDTRRADPLHNTAELALDTFRATGDEEWWDVVRQLMDLAPLIVVDGRTVSELVRREATHILCSSSVERTIFVELESGVCPLLDDVQDAALANASQRRTRCRRLSAAATLDIIATVQQADWSSWPALLASPTREASLSGESSLALGSENRAEPSDNESVAIRLRLLAERLEKAFDENGPEGADGALDSIRKLIERLEHQPSTVATNHALALGWMVLARADTIRGKDATAVPHLDKALAVLQRYSPGAGRERRERPLLLIHALIARAKIARRSRNASQALPLVREAAALAAGLRASELEFGDGEHAQSLAFVALGDVWLQLGNLGEAEQAFQMSIRALERVDTEGVPDQRLVRLYRDMAASHSRLGNVFLRTQQGGAALDRYRDARRWAERATAAAPNSPELVRDLAVAFTKMAHAYGMLQENFEAAGAYKSAIALLREILVEDPHRLEWLEDLAGDLTGRGLALMDLEDVPNARHHFAEAVATFDAISSRGLLRQGLEPMQRLAQRYLLETE